MECFLKGIIVLAENNDVEIEKLISDICTTMLWKSSSSSIILPALNDNYHIFTKFAAATQ